MDLGNIILSEVTQTQKVSGISVLSYLYILCTHIQNSVLNIECMYMTESKGPLEGGRGVEEHIGHKGSTFGRCGRIAKRRRVGKRSKLKLHLKVM